MPLEDLIKRADLSNYDESVVKDMPQYPGLSVASHALLKNIQVGTNMTCVVPHYLIRYARASASGSNKHSL